MTSEWHKGNVREYDDEEGVGVIDSPETPGGCWFHFAMIDQPIPGSPAIIFAKGRRVMFNFETVQRGTQDGYAYRAIEVRTVEAG